MALSNRLAAAIPAVAILCAAPMVTAAPPSPDAGSSGVTAPDDALLAWVNPARCVPRCAADPGDEWLARVDDCGAPSKRGKLRVHRAARVAGELLAAARAAGHMMRINSAFRSYEEQARVFRTMKERGRAARPGHSEHQLGTAIDLRLPTTAAIDWLGEHAYEFGFALSYPPGKQRSPATAPSPGISASSATRSPPSCTGAADAGGAVPRAPRAGRVGHVRRLPGGDLAQGVRRSPRPAPARGRC